MMVNTKSTSTNTCSNKSGLAKTPYFFVVLFLNVPYLRRPNSPAFL